MPPESEICPITITIKVVRIISPELTSLTHFERRLASKTAFYEEVYMCGSAVASLLNDCP
jgi:hypothetical protein